MLGFGKYLKFFRLLKILEKDTTVLFIEKKKKIIDINFLLFTQFSFIHLH